VIVDSLALRWLLPILAVGAALEAQNHGWGLFNRLETSFWFACIASLLLLDLSFTASMWCSIKCRCCGVYIGSTIATLTST